MKPVRSCPSDMVLRCCRSMAMGAPQSTLDAVWSLAEKYAAFCACTHGATDGEQPTAQFAYMWVTVPWR